MIFVKDLFRKAVVHEHPFRWIYILDYLPEIFIKELISQFPKKLLEDIEGRQGHYKLAEFTAVDQGKPLPVVTSLSTTWRGMIELLMSSEYRAAIEDLTAVDLTGCLLKIRPSQYGPGNWMQPHTDKEDRVVTQIIYLTKTWHPEWGGALRILNSMDEKDLVTEVFPMFNTSVIFVRSERSFHAVMPVHESCPETRRTILVQFIKPT